MENSNQLDQTIPTSSQGIGSVTLWYIWEISKVSPLFFLTETNPPSWCAMARPVVLPRKSLFFFLHFAIQPPGSGGRRRFQSGVPKKGKLFCRSSWDGKCGATNSAGRPGWVGLRRKNGKQHEKMSSSSNNFGTMAEAETEAADVKYSGKEVSFIAVRPSAVRRRFTRCSGRAEPSSSLDNCCCCCPVRRRLPWCNILVLLPLSSDKFRVTIFRCWLCGSSVNYDMLICGTRGVEFGDIMQLTTLWRCQRYGV